MEHLIKVSVAGNCIYLISINLFDSNNRNITPEASSNRLDYYFKQYPGIYKLRVTLNGAVKDQVFFLDKDMEFYVGNSDQWMPSETAVLITPPAQFTSATLSETYGSSHEYYTYPSIEHSLASTGYQEPHILENNSLYLFLRYPSKEMYDVYNVTGNFPILFDFKIVDEMGNLISDFKDRQDIAYDLYWGWLAFNMSLPTGLYYLIYSGNDARQIPIYVFQDWHTQVFMMLAEQPQFGTIRTFLAPMRKYDPEGFENTYIDTLLDALQNNDYFLEEDTVNIAAMTEHETPMLGLLCSYLYLRGESHINDAIFNSIVNNFKNVIFKNSNLSPDLLALEIILNSHTRQTAPRHKEISNPPMFRVGFEAILQASLSDDELIPLNSMNDYISENLFYDSPYTTFKPVDFNHVFKKERTAENEHFGSLVEGMAAEDKVVNFETAEATAHLPHFITSLTQLLGKDVLEKISNIENPHLADSWLKNSVAQFIREEGDLNMLGISEKLRIPKNTVMRILIELSQETQDL